MADDPDPVTLLRGPILVNTEHAGDPRNSELLTKPPRVQRGLPDIAPTKAITLGLDDERAVRPAQDVVNITAPVFLVAVKNEPPSIAELLQRQTNLAFCACTEKPVEHVIAAALELAQQHERQSG